MDNELSKREIETLRYIRNAVMHGQKTPSLRKLAKLLGYSSPRSATIITQKLASLGFIRRNNIGNWQILKDLKQNLSRARTVDVPLVGRVACGAPIFAEENIEAYIPVSIKLAKPGSKYYLLRAQGDSMNAKGISSGDLVLVKQQQTAEDGDSVVALINDEATIKEFHMEKDVIVLKPRSTNKEHQPIILDKEFIIQGKVVAAIPTD